MKPKKIPLFILLAIVLLNSIGFSIVLPLLPFLVGKYLPQQQVVAGMSALLSIYAACTFFAAPVLGALSDRFGRKIILMVSLLGSAVGFVLFGIGGALWVLVLGRLIDGLTAGSISAIFSYISDTTEAKERTKWFGYVGSVMGIGKIGGPALGGLLGSISVALPFYVTAFLIFFSAVLVYFLLPESLASHKRTKRIALNSFNVFSHFSSVFRLPGVALLLGVGVLFYIGIGVFQFNFTLFLKDVYEWSPALIGSLLTLVGICEILVRAALLPRLLGRFTARQIGIWGLLLMATGLVLILSGVYVHASLLISLAVVCIISGEGLFEPTYTGRLSESVDETQQGTLQGVNQSLQSLTNILVPVGGGVIYFYSAGWLYATATMVVLLAVVIYARSMPAIKEVHSL
ncbi:MFS transporter, DHA1 family, tetracycline resistance protein [Chitinophaga eiseniae]|uniref:MFS transporter, DHA1 family, tetracycline resistance protein n=1 Tax=Chitinophaga eiseniae TaxID=634771 RepID=A0A1T4MZW9_9BACT|nr:MFS transporter [Chitinophaga eiseniae]SJZ72406.1 MFS transporter, DHA1 family, tetracycline resistance protein [Chitinophaga eiseniae]